MKKSVISGFIVYPFDDVSQGVFDFFVKEGDDLTSAISAAKKYAEKTKTKAEVTAYTVNAYKAETKADFERIDRMEENGYTVIEIGEWHQIIKDDVMCFEDYIKSECVANPIQVEGYDF